jgi:hypothetical protein
MKQKLKELEEEAVKLRNTQVSCRCRSSHCACILLQPASSKGVAQAAAACWGPAAAGVFC